MSHIIERSSNVKSCLFANKEDRNRHHEILMKTFNDILKRGEYKRLIPPTNKN